MTIFFRCYAPAAAGLGGVTWQRTALPDAGGALDQDAWLMAALEYVCDVQNRMLLEDRRRRDTTPPAATPATDEPTDTDG